MIVYAIGGMCLAVSLWFARDAYKAGYKGWTGLFVANAVWDIGCMIGELMK